MPYAFNFADLVGVDRRINKNNSEYQSIKKGEIPYEFEYNKLVGKGKYEPAHYQMINGTYQDKNGGLSQFNKVKYKFMLEAPFEVSAECCKVMKKRPLHKFNRETHMMPITAQMADESRLRTEKWLKSGCNAFDNKYPISNPMSFWTEQDVLEYIYKTDLPIASVYGDIVVDYEAMGQMQGQMSLADYGWYKEHPLLKTTGCARTGCFACGYGMHLEKTCEECRISKTIEFSNPKLADWQLRGGAFDSDGLWKPKGGLGYWFVLAWVMKHSDIKYHVPDLDKYIEKYSTEETRRYLNG